ncbi:MAG: response regulator [Coriobacteriales bacterium]
MTGSGSILVIEDDQSIQHLLQLTLEGQGYEVFCAESGKVGLSLARVNNPNVILLDLGLPDCDGSDLIPDLLDICDAAIIVVTARDLEGQKVHALDAGADDYIVKPFGTSELLARIRVSMRRGASSQRSRAPVFEADGLKVDKMRYEVILDGEMIHLTPNEFALLVVLVESHGQVLTHRKIQQAVWGYPTTDNYKTLRVLMASLRRKLGERPSAPRFIKTEVGVGYRFIG